MYVVSFRTDTEITGNGTNSKDRELQRFKPDNNDDGRLQFEESNTKNGTWDQFAVNEKLYNVKSDYNEDLYTTSIDRNAPRYKQLADKAEKLAKEIEKDSDSRRSMVDSGMDEEDK